MQPESPNDGSIAQAAAEWVARHDRGLTAGEQTAFARWRGANPRHASEFERLGRTWHALHAAAAAPELSALADQYVVRARHQRARRRWRRFGMAGLAAAAAVAMGVATWEQIGVGARPARPPLVRENYRVLASTVQRTTLPDGTVAEMNGDSRIEIDFTPTERRVRLVQGEGHFVVAKNPAWPFIVTAGPVTVRAVGTAFNVRLASASIEVLVTEGEVKLEPAAASETATVAGSEAISGTQPGLVQGQRAVIDLTPATPAKVAIGEMGQSEIDDALGWQSTRLVFNNTPLDEVVAGFNRYNSRRLTLGDTRLRQRTVTGIFRADNLDGFIRLLQPLVDVKSEARTASETVLLPVR